MKKGLATQRGFGVYIMYDNGPRWPGLKSVDNP